jgi:mevalonate pyrophosphate decarboxylase
MYNPQLLEKIKQKFSKEEVASFCKVYSFLFQEWIDEAVTEIGRAITNGRAPKDDTTRIKELEYERDWYREKYDEIYQELQYELKSEL